MKIDAESRELTLTFLFLVIIVLMRIINSIPILVGDESYYSMRISQEIRIDPLISNDPLGEEYSFNIFHYFLAPLNDFMKSLVPIILGLLGGLFYYRSMNKNYRILSTSLLFVSPLFLTTFSQLSNVMFATFLVLLNSYNIYKRRIIAFTFVQTILALTHFEIWLFSTVYFIYTNRTYLAAIPGLLLSPLMFKINISPLPLFSEFGSAYGYSLFLFMLAIIGFIWRKKNPTRAVLLSAALVLSFYLPDIRILGTLIFAPYAARALKKLISRKWELPHLKQATIFLICLVLAFSAIAKTTELVGAEPNDLEVFEVLSQKDEGLVLSTQELGHYIQYYSRMPVIIDGQSSEIEVANINELLKSQDINAVVEQLRAMDVKYVLMPENPDRDGIFFVADNSQNLRILASDSYNLWEFYP